MGETINLSKIIGKGETKATLNSKKSLIYTTEPKYRVAGYISRNEKRRKVSLIKYENPESDIIKSWKILKEFGIPTVPTMRETDNDLYMTDMTVNGEEFYGKSKLREISNQTIIRRKKTDDFFILLTEPENLEAIKTRVYAICKLATENNIALANDDTFDLRIDKNGNFEVYCLDITGTRKLETGNFIPQVLEEENLRKAEIFISLLLRIRVELQSHQNKLIYKLQRIFVP